MGTEQHEIIIDKFDLVGDDKPDDIDLVSDDKSEPGETQGNQNAQNAQAGGNQAPGTIAVATALPLPNLEHSVSTSAPAVPAALASPATPIMCRNCSKLECICEGRNPRRQRGGAFVTVKQEPNERANSASRSPRGDGKDKDAGPIHQTSIQEEMQKALAGFHNTTLKPTFDAFRTDLQGVKSRLDEHGKQIGAVQNEVANLKSKSQAQDAELLALRMAGHGSGSGAGVGAGTTAGPQGGSGPRQAQTSHIPHSNLAPPTAPIPPPGLFVSAGHGLSTSAGYGPTPYPQASTPFPLLRLVLLLEMATLPILLVVTQVILVVTILEPYPSRSVRTSFWEVLKTLLWERSWLSMPKASCNLIWNTSMTYSVRPTWPITATSISKLLPQGRT